MLTTVLPLLCTLALTAVLATVGAAETVDAVRARKYRSAALPAVATGIAAPIALACVVALVVLAFGWLVG